MHSQRTLVAAGECFVARMHLQPEDRLLCVLPLFHINAIFYSLAGALAAGATLILAPRFSASRFWSLVHETGATEVNTIAAATSILLRRPRSEFRPGHALKKIYGAPFDAKTYRVFQQEFGVQTLIEGYGMSEIPGVLSNPFDGPHRVGSMGRPSPHPDPSAPLAEPRIADDSGRFLAAGEVGELVVRTPLLMQGYYRDPEQTAEAFRDGWFRTGDLAWVDGEGYFWFVARQKDIIRRRGENISGAELDRVVGSHPAVMEAAAIGVPSELGEDDILVAVVLRPGTVRMAQMELQCDIDIQPGPGSDVTLAIRPEDVMVRNTVAGSPNTFTARVGALEFLGSFCRADLQLGEGQPPLLADFSINLVRDLRIAEGMDLLVSLPPERIRVFPGTAKPT